MVLKLIIGSSLVGATLLNGCALFSPDMTEEETYANDPVARAALALRTQRGPASDPSQAAPAPRILPSDRLTLGMATHQVQALWGQPQEVENAGDPASGNQRWIYLNGLKRSWGTSNYRVVYFEKNQVVGWENHR
jgi:hypothetical protein